MGRLAARGTHDGEGEPGTRDDLLADALRVRVDVRPAPVPCAVLAGEGELRLHELPLHLGKLGEERGSFRRLPSGGEGLLGLLPEPALTKGIFGAPARLRAQLETLVDLALGIPDV